MGANPSVLQSCVRARNAQIAREWRQNHAMDRLEEDLKNIERSRSQEDLCGFASTRRESLQESFTSDDWFAFLDSCPTVLTVAPRRVVGRVEIEVTDGLPPTDVRWAVAARDPSSRADAVAGPSLGGVSVL